MNIDRRQLALAGACHWTPGSGPRLQRAADEDAVAKNVEAFRAALSSPPTQNVGRALPPPETQLQSLPERKGRGQGRPSSANAHRRKIEIPVAVALPGRECPAWDPAERRDSCGSTGWAKLRPPPMARKAPTNLSHPDELAKTGCGLETSDPRINPSSDPDRPCLAAVSSHGARRAACSPASQTPPWPEFGSRRLV